MAAETDVQFLARMLLRLDPKVTSWHSNGERLRAIAAGVPSEAEQAASDDFDSYGPHTGGLSAAPGQPARLAVFDDEQAAASPPLSSRAAENSDTTTATHSYTTKQQVDAEQAAAEAAGPEPVFGEQTGPAPTREDPA